MTWADWMQAAINLINFAYYNEAEPLSKERKQRKAHDDDEDDSGPDDDEGGSQPPKYACHMLAPIVAPVVACNT